MSNRLLGYVRMHPRGVFDVMASYEPFDLVVCEDRSYVALEEVEGLIPGTEAGESYWAEVAVGMVSQEAIELVINIVKENVEDLASLVKDPDYVRTENNFTSYYEELVIQIKNQ